MIRHCVAPVETIPENGNKAFDVAGRNLLLCRTGLGIFAVDNMCSHAFAHLEGGKTRGAHIFCPLHGARFDLRTGAPGGTLTKKPIATYPVSIEEGQVHVELPD